MTALSQYHNLYFVAYVDSIHVFEPEFPHQVVPTEPVLVINLPASRPNLRGYINHRKPQAANHIITRNLGDEEILLIACDSGDVIGYTTRSIVKTVLHRRTISGYRTCVVPSPFFHENVGDSAWGLDVHQNARLIAASCNTKEITIFAFALAQDGDNAGSSRDHEFKSTTQEDVVGTLSRKRMQAPLSPLWKTNYQDDWKHNRAQGNVAFPLRGHSANIPNISFLNSSDDKDAGPYLVSTDIYGKVALWNVWERTMCPLVSTGG